MGGSNLYGGNSSFKLSSSSIGIASGLGVFSSSVHREDDEEALKWAAIEKLPTFDRLRKGLLKEPLGTTNEVDVKNLSYEERKNLLERLVKTADEDNEKFLTRLRNRVDRVGIDMPTIEVRFENLSVEGEALVGSQALPTFYTFSLNLFESIFGFLGIIPNRKKKFPILRNISGVIKPCRMALLMGPPSSGKTTLLLALAGKLDSNLKFTGKVTYNGHSMNEFVPRRSSAYISQYDLHIGEMTVRETLAFSARCQGIGSRYDMLAELSRREKAANIKPDPDIDIYMKAEATEGQEASVVTDYVLKVLGLDICADTMVGDNMLRGISGGQKKRVTTGEMLVGPAKALLMDEISTGLDSSTTFQIVKSLRQYVHILKGTALISLLQPAPETYDLFDDIILISNNEIAYQGPREQVLPFFETMGFQCPERKGVADFLQEVTSEKDQRQYWARSSEPYRFVTVREFAESFKTFHVGQTLAGELAIPYDRTKSHPAALTTKMYGVSKRELLKACFAREVLLMKRNSFVYIFKLFQLAILAFVAMTVYLRTKMPRHSVIDGGIYLGALEFTVQMIFFNGISDIFLTVWKLPVFYKQRELLFFPAWAYAIPNSILKIPVSATEVALWIFLTYYVIGYDPNVGRFCKQFFLLFVLHQVSSGLYRFTGAAGRDPVLAYSFGLYALAVMCVMSGFVLSRKYVKKWWLWGYWTSPVMYASQSSFVVEFLGKKWSYVPPNATDSLGAMTLKTRGFFAESYWYWLGIAALGGMLVIFNICYILALTFINPPAKSQAFIAEENGSTVSGGQADSSARRSQSKERKNQIERSLSADQSRKKGMALPFEQHSITFDEIVYSVDMPQGPEIIKFVTRKCPAAPYATMQEMKNQGADDNRLTLLKGVSGAFRPGVLTALMGVSGAGKTTLMDVLAGRKTGGYIDGNISISGYPKKQETFARVSGYCEQNDIHSPHVTIYESLIYSAWLRLSTDVDAETRKTFVEEVMELVELTPLKGALVGVPGVNGLSTEQRKRLTIAVELVANPSIIFMDEPTSGLDARAAAIVMRTVRNTVDTGRTVVCTIHQPGIDIFEAFDELFLMKRGGQEIYVGPLGHNSCNLINYFEGIEGVTKIKDGYNPATWMLEVSSASQESILGVDFTELYKNSELYRRNKALIAELSSPRPGSQDLYFPTQYSQSFFTQCMACLWKQNWSYWRNPPYNAVRFYYTLALALAIGSMFWDLGGKRSERQDLFNAIGEVYIASFFLGVHSAAVVQPVVAVEQIVFYRERAAGMYSAMPYAFAQVMIELPYAFAIMAVYTPITYAMAGMQWTVAKFFWNFFFMYFTLLYFTFYGMLTVAVTPNQNIASVVTTLFYSFWNLFSGFLIPRTRIPVWWRWFYWTNPVAYSLYGLIVSQYGDRNDRLSTGETVKEFVRSYFGYKHDFLGVVAAAVVGYVVLFAFFLGLAIKYINYQRR